MPKVFNIGLSEQDTKTPPKLQAKQKATVTYNVTNVSGRQVRCRAVLDESDAPVKNKWVVLGTESEQDMKPEMTAKFSVAINLPPGVTPGKYAFHLNAVNADVTDEGDSGPAAGFEVTQTVTPRLPKWLLPVLAIVVLAIGGAVTWLLLSGGSKMPDVKGKNITEANDTLNKLHVSVQTKMKTVAADQENKVLDQDVPPNTKIEAGKTSVLLTVGAVTKMPDVRNHDLADAGIILAALHVAVQITTQPVAADQGNKVLDQNIPPGATIVADRTTVTLTVGDPKQKVPAIVGHLWKEDAAVMLAAAHFSNIKVEEKPATNVSSGYVSEVSPAVGVEMAATDPLVVVVAAPPVPQTIPVPRLSGLSFEQAAAMLTGHGLLLGNTSGNLVPGAIVQNSNPSEGQPVQLGAKISLAFPAPPGCVGKLCAVVLNSPMYTNALDNRAHNYVKSPQSPQFGGK